MKRTLPTAIALLPILLARGVAAQTAERPPDQEGIHRIGYSVSDKILQCVRDVYGKGVIYSGGFDLDAVKLADNPCPHDRNTLEEAFGQEHLSIFETPDWVYVTPSAFVDPESRRHISGPWTSLNISTDIRAANLRYDGPKITDGELQAAGEAALREARMCQAFPRVDQGATGQGTIEIEVAITKLKPDADGTDNYIAVIRQKNSNFASYARLAFERAVAGKYRVVWDSPLFPNSDSGIDVSLIDVSLKDVDGDGRDEFIVNSEQMGASSYPSDIVIFNREGRELSRQDCDPGEISGATCPIVVADGFGLFDESSGGPVQISANNDEHYALTNGVYVQLEKPSAAELRRKAAIENRRGLRLLSRSPARAATEFRSATGDDPTNAEYLNNLGFAEFKSSSYVDSKEALEGAIELDPGRAVAYLNLGDVFAAESAGIKTSVVDGRDPYAGYWEQLGHAYETDLEQARHAYEGYLELAPQSKAAPEVKRKMNALPDVSLTPADHAYLDAVFGAEKGASEVRRQNYADALLDYMKAASYHDREAKYAYEVGVCYLKLGKPEDALIWLNRAIADDPFWPDPYAYMGDAYAQLERFAQAREAYGRFLEHDYPDAIESPLSPESALAPEILRKIHNLPPL